MTEVLVRVIGIDSGPVPGFVIIDRWPLSAQVVEVVQCSKGMAPTLFTAILEDRAVRTVVQIEKFVVGRRASRSRTAGAGADTRDLIVELREEWADHDATTDGRLGGHWIERSAGQVKPWATDERLEAAGLLEITKGMRHARDAARHAIYVAVHDAGVPDPLSRKAHA